MLAVENSNQNVSQNQIIMFCKGSADKKLKYKEEALERLGINFYDLRLLFKKWTKPEIDALIIELSSYEIFFDTIVSTGTFNNNPISNIYLKVHFNNARVFLNKVQTLPMKRQSTERKPILKGTLESGSDIEEEDEEDTEYLDKLLESNNNYCPNSKAS